MNVKDFDYKKFEDAVNRIKSVANQNKNVKKNNNNYNKASSDAAKVLLDAKLAELEGTLTEKQKDDLRLAAYVQNPVAKNYQKKILGNKNVGVNSVVNEFKRLCYVVLNDHLAVLFVIFAATIVFSHFSGVSSGFLESFLSGYKKKSSIVDWIYANEKKFLGMIVFLPVCYKIQESLRIYVLSAVIIWIFIFKSMPIFEYVFLALCLFFYFKTVLSSFRFLVIGVSLFAIFTGKLSLGVSSSISNSTR